MTRIGPLLGGDRNILGDEPRQPRMELGFTEETIESVLESGHYLVRGYKLATTGQKIFRKGERAIVAWRDDRPVAIVGHSWRRAQFHAVEVPVEAAGDLISVFADVSDSGNSLIVFTSFLQGDFTVDVTDLFGLPTGLDKDLAEAVFCQNDPSVVAYTWETPTFFLDPAIRNFLVLQILDSETGEFSPRIVDDVAQTSVYKTKEISQADATELKQFILKEDGLVIRTVTERLNVIWQDAQWEVGICFIPGPPAGPPGDSLTVVDSTLFTLELAPQTVDFVTTFGPKLRGAGAGRRMFCIDVDGAPEVFLLVEDDRGISVSPTSFSVSTTTFDSFGNQIAGPTFLVTRSVPSSSRVFLTVSGFHVPLYVLNASQGTVVFRTLEAATLFEIDSFHSFSGQLSSPTTPGSGDPFFIPVRVRDDCSPSSGFVTVFMLIGPSVSSFSKPTHVRGRAFFPGTIIEAGRRNIGLPTPFASEPWITENTDRASASANTHFTGWVPTAIRTGTGAFTVSGIPNPATVGRFNSTIGGLNNPFTRAEFANPAAYLEKQDGLLDPILNVTFEGGASVEKLADWNGTVLADIIDSAADELRVLHINQRFAVLVELTGVEPPAYSLFDREENVVRPLSSQSVANFEPGVNGEDFLVSERRLAYVGTLSDKTLLAVSVDEDGEILLTSTGTEELEADEPADPDTFPLVRGRTSAVFPEELEEEV